ncbi:MAG: DUF362 domain-containing protein [Chloroflexi bacterium]|nr:DUF362 domain-containing protein [Chloroflexota bacterium]
MHEILNDPLAVVILQHPKPSKPTDSNFYTAAQQSAAILQLALDSDVAFKPNATAAERFKAPASGIGTHPAFMHGLLDYLREHGARDRSMYVIEDPANDDYGAPPSWLDTGYLELAEATGAILEWPTTANCVERAVAKPNTLPTRRVIRHAVDSAMPLINVPKLKTHNLSLTTLCIKNLMGLNYGPERHFCSQAMGEMPAFCIAEPRSRIEWLDEELHECWQAGLARRLTDLAQVIKPQLNLVEGIVGRDGTGFQRGTNHTLGLVIAGTNMVAVDALTSHLMGFDPLRLIYLQVAAEAGLGSNRLDELHCYTNEGDTLVPCRTLAPFMADPPFVVNRMLKGSESNIS